MPLIETPRGRALGRVVAHVDSNLELASSQRSHFIDLPQILSTALATSGDAVEPQTRVSRSIIFDAFHVPELREAGNIGRRNGLLPVTRRNTTGSVYTGMIAHRWGDTAAEMQATTASDAYDVTYRVRKYSIPSSATEAEIGTQEEFIRRQGDQILAFVIRKDSQGREIEAFLAGYVKKNDVQVGNGSVTAVEVGPHEDSRTGEGITDWAELGKLSRVLDFRPRRRSRVL